MDERLDRLDGQVAALAAVITQVLAHVDHLTAMKIGAGLAIEAEALANEDPHPARDQVLAAYSQLLLARASA